jgi:hypothetical protein
MKVPMCRYRQSKYKSNYSDDEVETTEYWWAIAIVAILFSPFIAAFILNPYMWILALSIFGAYKLVHMK